MKWAPATDHRIVTAGILVAVLAVTGWSPAISDPMTGTRLTDSSASVLAVDSAPPVIGPVIDVVDAVTGRTLYSRFAYRRHAIGSITKLMTAMLTVKRLKLARVVTVSAKAASTPGSTMGLMRGDRLTVRALLTGLLLPSGNDAAEELAETMAGSDRGWARLANRQVRLYGLRCSRYVTPHGLDAKGQYSCAGDVATMTRLVLANHLLARIVATKQTTVRGVSPARSFRLQNTNLLLRSYPGAIGVKTGTTDQAGASLSAASRRGGHVVIAVVLGSTALGRFSDGASLLTFGFRDFLWPRPVDTLWSTASLMTGRSPLEAPVPRWEAGWITVGQRGMVSAPYDSHR